MHLQTCGNVQSANHKRIVSQFAKWHICGRSVNLTNTLIPQICGFAICGTLFADRQPLSAWHLQWLRIRFHLYGSRSWIRIWLRILGYRMPQFWPKVSLNLHIFLTILNSTQVSILFTRTKNKEVEGKTIFEVFSFMF